MMDGAIEQISFPDGVWVEACSGEGTRCFGQQQEWKSRWKGEDRWWQFFDEPRKLLSYRFEVVQLLIRWEDEIYESYGSLYKSISAGLEMWVLTSCRVSFVNRRPVCRHDDNNDGDLGWHRGVDKLSWEWLIRGIPCWIQLVWHHGYVSILMPSSEVIHRGVTIKVSVMVL